MKSKFQCPYRIQAGPLVHNTIGRAVPTQLQIACAAVKRLYEQRQQNLLQAHLQKKYAYFHSMIYFYYMQYYKEKSVIFDIHVSH